MALQEEQVVDIPGLSGEEIIIDMCEQIAAKLRRDCNLRPQDSYVNGYMAKIKFEIECYGIDAAKVETVVEVSKAPETITAGPAKTTEIETEVVIAHEPDLNEVRDRSDLPAPDVEQLRQNEAGVAEPKNSEEPQRRRYAGKPPRVAGGGAGSFSE